MNEEQAKKKETYINSITLTNDVVSQRGGETHAVQAPVRGIIVSSGRGIGAWGAEKGIAA